VRPGPDGCIRTRPPRRARETRPPVAPKACLRLDAQTLARLGAERQPDPDAPLDPAREELRDLVQRRDQLKRMQVQEKNRLARCRHPLVEADIRAELATLADRLTRIEAAIAEHAARHPELAAADRLLRSIPGIGPVSSMVLLAYLGELGRLDRRAVASLAGLAPRARESGRYRGKRFLGDGRRQVRRVLYMAAASTMLRERSS
jgi:transposase